jgi:hypothetical protein
VEFPVDNRDQESSLRVLKSGRENISKLVRFAEPLAQRQDKGAEGVLAFDKKTARAFNRLLEHEDTVRSHLSSVWDSCPILAANAVHLAALPICHEDAGSSFLAAHHEQPVFIETKLIRPITRRYVSQYASYDSTLLNIFSYSRPRVFFSVPSGASEEPPTEEALNIPNQSLCALLRIISLIPGSSISTLAHDRSPSGWQANISTGSEDRRPHFVSLEALLTSEHSLSDTEKLGLMSILARCFLAFGKRYRVWRKMKRDVLFREEPTSNRRRMVDLERPFLGLRCDPKSLVGEDSELFAHCFHSHPLLLELGVLLLEIYLGTAIEAQTNTVTTGGSQAPTIYSDYVTAWQIVSQPDFDESAKSHCAAAIKSCLSCHFLPVGLEPHQDPYERLTYKYIVRPLELQQVVGSIAVLDPDESDEEHEDALSAEQTGTETQPQGGASKEGTASTMPVILMSAPTEGSQQWRIFDDLPFSAPEYVSIG